MSCTMRRSINENTNTSRNDVTISQNDVTALEYDETGDLVTCLSCCVGEFCNSGGCGSLDLPATNRGPICFFCPKGSSAPEQCDKLATCGRDEHCGIQPFNGVGGDVLYKTGCTHSCSLDAVGTILGKRDTACFGCCDRDYCNSNCSAFRPHGLVTPTKGSHPVGTSPHHSSGTTHGTTTPGIIDRSTQCKQLQPDYTYLRDYDHCVRIYNGTKLSWFQSRDRCKKDGGQLLIFHNKNEEGYFEALTEKPTAAWDTKRYWIGASDLEHEGQWTWVDNTSVRNAYFFPGEPNDGDARHNEDCGATAFINRTFLINDDVCDNQYHFICEIILPASPIKTTEIVRHCQNKHYTLSLSQDICFHVYDDRAMTMEQARQVCQREHADLLQLKNRNAEQFFLDYGFIDKENNDRRYWLGAHKHGDGQFYWLNGHRLDDSYIWAPGEPNNFHDVEECLDLTWFAAKAESNTPAAFALNDDDCTRNYFFICEETRG